MAHQNTRILLLAAALLMANSISTAHDIPITANPRSDLTKRLQEATTSNATDCWTALSELRSCSNEIVAFFLNGYTDIDTPCCNAIEIITKQCWPSMLNVLGFTTEEGNLLAGYCEKSSAPAGAPPAFHSDGLS